MSPFRLALSSLVLVAACGDAPSPSSSTFQLAPSAVSTNGVKITRDDRGVPHIQARSLADAMWGLGYATLEDRAFQMFFRRAYMRGRMAEFFAKANPDGDATIAAFNQRLIDGDKFVRTVGYARSNEAKASQLAGDLPRLLQAYADGVNARLATTDVASQHAFQVAGITTFDRWTPADSLLVWDWVGVVFGGSDLEDELKNYLDCTDDTGCTVPVCSPPLDEAAANVPPPDDGQWPPAGIYTASLQGDDYRPPPVMKASHAAAVAGTRTTDGKPVLFGEPQLELFAPSTWYESVINVPGLDVRGASFAGAPGMVVFWNRHVAQTVTAGGGNPFDFVALAPGSRADRYVVDGVEHTLSRRTETIFVRGGAPVPLTIESSIFGPVGNALVAPWVQVPGRLFAVRRAEDLTKDRHSVGAAINIMRADSLKSYHAALNDWFSPSVNAIYAGVDAGDPASHGHIAYHSLGILVDRRVQIVSGRDYTGHYPIDGSSIANDWRGLHSIDWRPHIADPSSGFIVNGNSSPVGRWYDQLVPGASLAGSGDTYRSLQIRHTLSTALADPGSLIDVDDVHALHFSDRLRVIEIYRDMLAYIARRHPGRIDDSARAVLTALNLWTAAGAHGRSTDAYSPLINELPGTMTAQSRRGFHPITACAYNAGEGGISFLWKTFVAAPDATMDRAVMLLVLDIAKVAWARTLQFHPELSADPTNWQPRSPSVFTNRYQVNWVCLIPGAGSSCSLDPAIEAPFSLDHDNFATVGSPGGSSFPITVPFGDLSRARALLPPGVSEEPRSPHFRDALPLIQKKGEGDPESMPLAPLASN